MAQFNISFLNPDFYATCKHPHLSHHVMEDNRPMHKGKMLMEEVFRFMFSTEVHQLSGLSFNDIMDMDLDTYHLLKKVYDDVEKPKREVLKQLQADVGKQNKTNFGNNTNSIRRTNERKHLRTR